VTDRPTTDRQRLVRRGLVLSALSVALGGMFAIVALFLALSTGSVALLAFGADAAIDSAASIALIWRFQVEASNPARAAHVDARAHRIVGFVLLGAAALVAFGAIRSLVFGSHVDPSVATVILYIASIVLLPPLAIAKRRTAIELASDALRADAFLTAAAAILAGIGLAGFVGATSFGLTWADPIGALVIAAVMAREGRSSISEPTDS
jgi:divalent metal cation (Fe/Co/Zn/Cd) transporter